MAHAMTKDRQAEKGFTLVELAVVMIIIGLLIGGILKGQELITNAEIAATVSQIKGIDGATSTFRDRYDAFPGDMINANTRLPATCGGAACANGDGNGVLNVAPAVAQAGTEGVDFFQHLAAGDLLGGIDFANAATWGGIYPQARINGGFHAGYHPGTVALLGSGVGVAPAGHYLTIVLTPGAATAGNSLTPNQAQRIDTKLDDGVPASGSAVSTGGNCVNGNLYNESNQGLLCDIAVRIQG